MNFDCSLSVARDGSLLVMLCYLVLSFWVYRADCILELVSAMDMTSMSIGSCSCSMTDACFDFAEKDSFCSSTTTSITLSSWCCELSHEFLILEPVSISWARFWLTFELGTLSLQFDWSADTGMSWISNLSSNLIFSVKHCGCSTISYTSWNPSISLWIASICFCRLFICLLHVELLICSLSALCRVTSFSVRSTATFYGESSSWMLFSFESTKGRWSLSAESCSLFSVSL